MLKGSHSVFFIQCHMSHGFAINNILSQLCWVLFGMKKKWSLFGRRLIVIDFASNGSPSIENQESCKQQMKETVTMDKPDKLAYVGMANVFLSGDMSDIQIWIFTGNIPLINLAVQFVIGTYHQHWPKKRMIRCHL